MPNRLRTYSMQLVFCLILFSAANVVQAQLGFLSVYTEESFPLNYTLSDQGSDEIVGYVTELTIAILENAGVEYKIELVPWVRALNAIDSRENVMVYSMTRSVDRENKYQWIGPTLPINYFLFGLKSNRDSLPSTLDNAKDLRIGIVRKDVTSGFLSSAGFSNLITVSEPERNLRMLERGRTDLFPFSIESLGPMIVNNGFDPNDFYGAIKLEPISTDLYFAISKQTSVEMFDQLQRSFDEVVASGLYDQILQPYFERNRLIRVQTVSDIE